MRILRKFINILIEWSDDKDVQYNPWIQGTILVSLFFSTYYETAYNQLIKLLQRQDWKNMIGHLFDEQVLFLSYGMFAPFFDKNDATDKIRNYILEKTPWLNDDDIKAIIISSFKNKCIVEIKKNSGGWETNIE